MFAALHEALASQSELASTWSGQNVKNSINNAQTSGKVPGMSSLMLLGAEIAPQCAIFLPLDRVFLAPILLCPGSQAHLVSMT